MNGPSDFVDQMEVCRLAGFSVDTLRAKMRRGVFPRPTHQRGRRNLWLRSVVVDAISAMTRPIGEHRVSHLPPGAEAR